MSEFARAITESELMKIAEKLARQRIVVEKQSFLKIPTDTEERVKLEVSIMLERSKLALLEKEYDIAFLRFVSQM